MSVLDEIRARLTLPTSGESALIEQMLPSDAASVRLPWTSRFSAERIAAQVSANPHLSIWMPETGEYALAEAWRSRSDIAHIIETSTRRGQHRLVSTLLDRARLSGYKLMVLQDDVMSANRKLYAALGFVHLERVIILRRDLGRGELPNLQAYPTVTTRPASPADIDTLLTVDNGSFPWLWWNSRTELENYITMPGVSIDLAFVDGVPVGYTSFTEYDGWAHLDRIGVITSAQGRGLGAAQLLQALCKMKVLGAKFVALSTQLSNTQSHKLYDRFEFVRTGESMDFFGLKL